MLYHDDPVTIWCAGIRRDYYTSKQPCCSRDPDMKTAKLPHAIKKRWLPQCSVHKTRRVFQDGFLTKKSSHGLRRGWLLQTRLARRIRNNVVYKSPGLAWYSVTKNITKQDKCILSISSHALKPTRFYYMIRNRIVFHRKYNIGLQMWPSLSPWHFLPHSTSSRSCECILTRPQNHGHKRCVRGIKDGVFHRQLGRIGSSKSLETRRKQTRTTRNRTNDKQGRILIAHGVTIGILVTWQ